jgi:hypothetical protein
MPPGARTIYRFGALSPVVLLAVALLLAVLVPVVLLPVGPGNIGMGNNCAVAVPANETRSSKIKISR